MTQKMVMWTSLEQSLALVHSTAAIEASLLWELAGACVKEMESGLERHQSAYVGIFIQKLLIH